MSLLNSLKLDLLRAALILTGMQLKRERLYAKATALLGTDFTPSDVIPDDVGCAEAVSKLLQLSLPELNFPLLTYTPHLHSHFEKSPSFTPTDTPQPVSVILSVTGTGNGKLPNGHVGIIGKKTAPDGSLWVMSNNSFTGRWEVTHSVDRWRRYYETFGGMPTHFYTLV